MKDRTAGDPGANEVDIFPNAFQHPLLSTTLTYNANGILLGPQDDLGDPHTNTLLLEAFVDADNLSAADTGEYIRLRDWLNGADPVTAAANSRGNFLSGDLDLSYGASAEGVSARKLQWELQLNRAGTTTNTPRLYDFEVDGQHLLLGKEQHTFTIDLEKSLLHLALPKTRLQPR